jgi:hypothetical protein
MLVVPIGNQQHTLMSVLWFCEMVEDGRLPGLRRVRVGRANIHTDDHLIRARRIDSLVWLTSSPNQPAWHHVYFKNQRTHHPRAPVANNLASSWMLLSAAACRLPLPEVPGSARRVYKM